MARSTVTYQVGQMQEFDPETELIKSYIEQLEMFFTVNDIATAKQVPVLLTVIGKTTFSLLRIGLRLICQQNFRNNRHRKHFGIFLE